MSSIRPDQIVMLQLLTNGKVLDIAVRVWGSENPKATLFCLHGFVGTGQDFAFIGAMLRDQRIQTVAMDLPGRGASAFLGEESHYSQKLLNVVLHQAMRLATGPVVLAGTAWGGVIAASMAANLQHCIRGLMLVDTPLASDGLGDLPHEDFLRDEAFRQFSTLQSARVYYAATRNLNHISSDELDEMVSAAIMRHNGGFRMSYDPALIDTIRRRGPFDLTEALCSADIPILALLGQYSHINRSESEKLARTKIPRMEELICYAEAHPPSLSRPKDLAVIRDFVLNCVDQNSLP